MVVIKWSDAIKGQRVRVDDPQCGGLYKEDNESIIILSGTDPDAKMKTSITGKDLLTMVNSASKIYRR